MIKKSLSLAAIAVLGITYWVSAKEDTINPSNTDAKIALANQDLKGVRIAAASPNEGIDKVLAVMNASQNHPLVASGVTTSQQKAFFPTAALKHGGNVYITGQKENPVLATTADDARKLLLKDGSGYLGAGPDDNLNIVSSQRDERGNAIYKYQQTYKDVPIFGRELVVQISPNNELNLVAGQFEPSVNLSTVPRLSGNNAISTAIAGFATAPTTAPVVLEKPTLMVYTDENTKPVLAWKASIEYTTQSTGYNREHIIIDANTGKALNHINMMQAFTYGVYTVNQKCLAQNDSGLPGTLIADNADDHSKGVAANGVSSYWFYKNMFNRDSWDGKGVKLTTTIHAKFQGSNNTCVGDNAYFTGTQLLFGDGQTNLKNPGAAIDIFGHEFSHGFTEATSKLIYQNDSGALNESISDIMGTGISAWFHSGGSATGNPTTWAPTEADWNMGEDAALTLSWKRFMQDPAKNGQQKDNYTDRVTGTTDNGGVHTNSGIMNLAFYLLSQGGSHPRQKTTNVVKGIGIEKALRVMYYSNANLFTSSTSFTSVRNLTANAAKTLYGCSEWESVHQAWDAVKVPGTRGTECTATTDTNNSTGGGTTTPPPSTGSNLALGTATKASSTYSISYPVKNATDGQTTTPWVSRTIMNPYTTEYVQLNLGTNKTFTTANLSWAGSDSAKRIAVWVYKNNAWTLVADKTGTTAITSITFAAQTAKDVMITMQNGTKNRWYAINEITLK